MLGPLTRPGSHSLADALEVARLLKRFHTEYDEPSPDADVWHPACASTSSTASACSCWPAYRNYPFTGEPTCYSRSSTWCSSGAARATGAP